MMLNSHPTYKRPSFSPLRYPGGKSALYPLLSQALRANGMAGGTYVEPYAGGAGVALGLLLTEQVNRIVLNDLDPAIYAFWTAVTRHGQDFMERVAAVIITVGEWDRQKDIYENRNAADPVTLGFATFFLNRTNRSGVLNGGIIGGRAQTGPYKIDARFNRTALLEKIRLISLYSRRIEVRHSDGVDVIEEFAGADRTLIFADPPYFEKGSQLYLNAFDAADHVRLANCLNAHSGATWLLTYDDCCQISDLYTQRPQRRIPVNYSARDHRRATELLITSDQLLLTDGV